VTASPRPSVPADLAPALRRRWPGSYPRLQPPSPPRLQPASPSRLAIAIACAWLLATAWTAGIAHAEPDVRLPPGTRSDAQGQLVSGRGIRETSDFLAHELAHRGIAVDQIGPYGARGAVITRFVSQTPATPWLALHVLRVAGKTLIFFVPRAKSAVTP
jgi:hypothetical protein